MGEDTKDDAGSYIHKGSRDHSDACSVTSIEMLYVWTR